MHTYIFPPPATTPTEQQSMVIELADVLGCGHHHREQLIIFPPGLISGPNYSSFCPAAKVKYSTPSKGGGRQGRTSVNRVSKLTHNTSPGFHLYSSGAFHARQALPRGEEGGEGSSSDHRSGDPAWSCPHWSLQKITSRT